MLRTITLTCLGALLLGGCAAPPSVAESSSTSAPPETTTSTTAAPTLDTYRYRVTLSGATVIGTELELVVDGAVDGDNGVGEMRYSAGQGAPETVVVQSAAGFAVLAPAAEMLPARAGEIDPTQWYELEVESSEGADVFFLSATPTAESLWELLAVTPQRSVDAAGESATAVITRADVDPLWGSNTLLDFIGRNFEALQLTTENDSEGFLARVEINSVDPAEEGSLLFLVSDRGAPIDIFVPQETLPIPIEEWEPPVVVPPPTMPPVAIVPDAEGVLFRLSTLGGWELAEKPARHLTLMADGLLVRVINPDVLASAEDFSALRLSTAGVEELVALIEESGLLETPGLLDGGGDISPTRVTTTLWTQGRAVLTMDRAGQIEGYTGPQIEARSRFTELIALLEDPAWLGDEIISDWKLWIPETLTVLAGDVSPRSGLPPDAPFAPWPLEEPIEDLASGTTPNAYDEERLVLCLGGAQVAPVWELLTGVNNAYLRVDDGTEWELTYLLTWPGHPYRPDHC